ncbi:D-sedoheptulose-7-phosphate isomerase [Novispirillum itersonii]|uniref:Phosphoheptose isomerase n=1 Tax=Novispirillum itersonii TaxID=189 RepID=A0A7W9ZII4_NOVIT|nr:SIS domain-containing protein [Novispirillum itersonii]MBB6212080.1 D-sedoheptulose 7-phosphate isomerase [Novispirillum itersonii]
MTQSQFQSRSLSQYLLDTSDLHRRSAEASLDAAMDQALDLLVTALKNRLPVLVCGNGGSMADAQHIAGELVARFRLERQGLPVIALGTNAAALTAWSNDYDYPSAYAREVEAFGRPGGVLIAITTSGNSPNVVAAAEKARALGLSVVAMTGAGGGKMAALSDALLAVPSKDTPRIQEVHIALYHFLCEQVELRCA